MRKFLPLAFLLFLAVPAKAQLVDFSGNVVVGGSYRVSNTDLTTSRGAFLVTANLSGIRVAEGVYFGGVGVQVPSVLANSPGIALSVPVVTWFPKANLPVLVQGGWAYDLTGDVKSQSVYGGVGWSFTTPAAIKAKRLKRAQEKAKKGGN
jgi:hypothetical protein